MLDEEIQLDTGERREDNQNRWVKQEEQTTSDLYTQT